MYGLPPEIVKPGCTLRELLEHRKRAGTFAGDRRRIHRRSVLAIARAGTTPSRLVELPDGRTIAVLNHPMPDGGWVSDPRGHHRAPPRREADRPYGAPRRADRPAQPRAVARAARARRWPSVDRGGQLAVLYLDLDHFKSVNDTLGHHDRRRAAEGGGRTGCATACAMTDTVARVGGDEFAIIQTGIERAGGHRNPGAADRAKRCARPTTSAATPSWSTPASASRSRRATAPSRSELLKARRHGALRRQGRRPRHLSLLRAGDGRAHEGAARARAARCAQALAAGEFELHYQPLVKLDDSAITGCEALLRWNHPERGMISPAEFIPVAEEIGLIVPLGEWVLRKACADAAAWPDDIKVAVNLSPIQVMNQNLVPVVIGALAARRPAGAAAGARNHRIRADAEHRGDARPRCTGCASSACASRWTISAPAIRR